MRLIVNNNKRVNMTFIQQSLTETKPVFLARSDQHSDNGDGFEGVLDEVVLKKASQLAPETLDTKARRADSSEDQLTLDSENEVSEEELLTYLIENMMRQAVPIEHIEKQIQTAQINLTQENASAEPLQTVSVNLKQESAPTMSTGKEVASHDQTVELMPTVPSVGDRIDKSAVTVDSDRAMDEVPIVSITLKRDPVIHAIPVNKSVLNSKHENLTSDYSAEKGVADVKTSADVVQAAQSTDSEQDSLMSDSNESEPLLENSTQEGAGIAVHRTGSADSFDIAADVTESKSIPTQQLQQAILTAKEGLSHKESTTLTVVLNPEELGTVNVELTSDAAGKLSAVLSVEKRETLDVLQRDLHQLKTVLNEIGIDESSISLQLSSNNEQGQQKQSEYIAWEDREHMLMRSSHTPVNSVTEKVTYPDSQGLRRLDIKA
jgi:flagellar hook-length control protein FliK